MITVTLEPDELLTVVEMERCAICRVPTRTWYVPKDVAVCEKCAKQANADDIPDKKTWLRRERIASPG